MPHERPVEPNGYTHQTLLRAGGKGRFQFAHEVAELIPIRSVSWYVWRGMEFAAVFGFLAVFLLIVCALGGV